MLNYQSFAFLLMEVEALALSILSDQSFAVWKGVGRTVSIVFEVEKTALSISMSNVSVIPLSVMLGSVWLLLSVEFLIKFVRSSLQESL
ncbi:123_t:CDS:2 [Funneliformis mosseae]|uniref:123_t:CDS:1 n=1 Tax=Funneliformis mosseae TaxID=27381 RepID=A0A9N9CCX4_FUNMO|nr:123_t:CDS:2 [Funneliformis mosseae]